jgi:hypothetical protein
MNTPTISPPTKRAEDQTQVTCLCGRPHPCPAHGAWNQPWHEQLTLTLIIEAR